MYRTMGNDFEMIKGEAVLRVRNENKGNMGKKLNLGWKGKEKRKKTVVKGEDVREIEKK